MELVTNELAEHNTHDSADRMQRIAAHVARNLASFQLDERGAYIRTPLTYPGGAGVVVLIQESAGYFLVTDMGFGMSEAELIGAERQFVCSAPEIAKRYGVEFEDHSFFLSPCERDQLIGAVGAIANCSKEAVDLASSRLTDPP